MLQGCYRNIIYGLKECYMVLKGCYMVITVVLQACWVVTEIINLGYRDVLEVSQGCCGVLQECLVTFGYLPVLLWHFQGFSSTVIILLWHCPYIFPLHSWYFLNTSTLKYPVP